MSDLPPPEKDFSEKLPAWGLSRVDDHLEKNCFFIKGDRHDQTRVEFQFGFDGTVSGPRETFSYDVDFLLFVPKSLGLGDVETISNLRNEFQSYVRLHTHLSNPHMIPDLRRLIDHIENLKTQPSREEIRLFTIDIDAFLETTHKKSKDAIKDPTPESEKFIIENLLLEQSLLKEFRILLEHKGLLHKHASEFSKHSIDHDFLLSNEFISHRYVQSLCYLSDLILQNQLPYSEALKTFEQERLREHKIREDYGLLLDQNHNLGGVRQFDKKKPDQLNEHLYLRRINLIKKYFQRALFVNVTGSSNQTRLYLPVYGLAAAISAAFAVIVQIYQFQDFQSRLSINSMAVISIAIVAYVIKDILKDYLRKSFYKSGSKFIPDFEKKLFVEKEGRKQKLGSIKEYLQVYDSHKLPNDLRNARYNSTLGGEIEESLHEDVLHFKKRVELNLHTLDNPEKSELPWGFREIVRYRFDRFFSSMEDAYRKIYLLKDAGDFTYRRSHRVYHVYGAAWISATGGKHNEIQPFFRAFRMTLDRQGLIACQQVSWPENLSPPTMRAWFSSF